MKKKLRKKDILRDTNILIEFTDWLQNAYNMGMSSSAINNWKPEIRWFKKVINKATGKEK